jgi:pentatricopeptide repeat protein
MKSQAGLKPDEIMYNSLLDGCAQNNLVDEGMRILDQMEAENVKPSNFTLSILVKMMNRGRKLDSAFSLVDRICKQYRFKPNVHVYTNLIQACVSNRQLPRGMQVLEQMIKEKIHPDNRTYTVLVRGCVTFNILDQAVGVLRAGLGLPNALPSLSSAQAQSITFCNQLNPQLVSETLNALCDRGRAQEFAQPLLVDIKQYCPRMNVDAATQRKVVASGMAEANGEVPVYQPPPPSLKGRGKGGPRDRRAK